MFGVRAPGLGGALLSSGTRKFGFPVISELLSVFLGFPGNAGTGTQKHAPGTTSTLWYEGGVVWGWGLLHSRFVRL